MCCFTETNRNYNIPTVAQQIQDQFRRYWTSHITLQTSNSSCTFGSEYQPGGTMTALSGTWTTRIIDRGQDSGLGRWSFVTLQGRHANKITLITAYRVCNQTIDHTGDKTAFIQQWVLLRETGIHKPNPRKAFMTDLTQYIKELREANHSIILFIDANESRHGREGSIPTFLQATGLTDILYGKFATDTHQPPATYKRGTNCIDYAFVTPEVIPFIKACGYTAFDEVTPSDHRGIFLDIDLQSLLRCSPSPIESPDTRILSSTNPRNLRCYKAHLYKYLDDHNWYQRMHHIRNHPSSTVAEIEEGKRQAQAGLNDLIRGMKVAESRLSQRPTNPFSEPLFQQRKKTEYWRSLVSELRTGTNTQAHRQAITEQIQWKPPKNTGSNLLDFALTQLQSSVSEEKQLSQHATDLRIVFLAERMEYYSLQGKASAVKIIQRIKRAEAKARMWKKFHTMTNKDNQKGGLHHIRIPDEHGDLQDVYDPETITASLVSRNFKHFGQASNTPFAIEPIRSIMEPYGTNVIEAVPQLLENPEIDKATKTLLTQLRDLHAPVVSNQFSSNDLRNGFTKWREKTSTSPEGTHLGHYKAILAPDETPAEHKERMANLPTHKRREPHHGTSRTGDDVLKGMADLVSFCHRSGTPLDQWLKIINVMLEKIPGNPRIDKLRVIHLFDALWNLSLGIIWNQRLQSQAEALQLLNDGQWGSRKGKNSIDVVLLKQFTYETARLSRTSLITFDNDAKSCYDRIVMTYCLALCQRMGLPSSTATAFGKFLDNAKYYLKTKLQTSDEPYSSSPTNPLHGPGQGSRVGPPMWLFISSQIMQAFETHHPGLSMHDPTGWLQVTRIIDGFVDDTTLWVNDFEKELSSDAKRTPSKELITNLLNEAQQAAQWWEQLLGTSQMLLLLGELVIR